MAMALKIILPRNHGGELCLWTDVTMSHIDILSNVCDSPESIKTMFTKIFGITDSANPHSQIVLDMFYYGYQFAKENDFSGEQTSAVLSIINKVHRVAIETPLDNMKESWNYFENLLLCHAFHHPPYSLKVFSTDDLQLIITYMLDTYFRRFKMYKYAFTQKVELDLALTYDCFPNEEPSDPVEDHAEDQFADVGEEEEATVGPAASDVASQAVDSETQDPGDPLSVLRSILRTHLRHELQRLQLTIDDQIRAVEEMGSGQQNKLLEAQRVPSAQRSGSSTRGKRKS